MLINQTKNSEKFKLRRSALILKDWLVNMRKKVGAEFKEATVQTM